MSYILEVDHLNKAYTDFELKDINFKLEHGMIMGLVGRNGAGKTTLIQTILGILKYDGNIKIQGLDCMQYEKETKDICSFVLDKNPFIVQVSALGNARMFGPYYSKWDEKKFIEYAKKFGVNIKKPLNKLSDGTVIKFQLAFALSHEAKLFVFDEPSAGLDPFFRKELMDIMYEIVESGECSVLFSTHLTQDLDQIADYITMLDQGKVLFSMSKEEMLDQYCLVKGNYTQIHGIEKKRIIGIRDTEVFSEGLIYKEGFKNEQNLNCSQPTIEDIMYYMTKGSEELE